VDVHLCLTPIRFMYEKLFENSPTLSIRRYSLQLDMPHSTVYKISRKNFPYRITLFHDLKPQELPKCFQMCSELQELLKENPFFLNSTGFSDECIVWLCGKTNRQNVRFWRSERPDSARTIERDSPEVLVWCAVLHDWVIEPFSFHEPTVRCDNYLDILENYTTLSCCKPRQSWVTTSSFNGMERRHIRLMLSETY
jgi:hypothetical protein